MYHVRIVLLAVRKVFETDRQFVFLLLSLHFKISHLKEICLNIQICQILSSDALPMKK